MSQNVINEHTDEKIKDYLSEEKTGDLKLSNNADSKENKKRNIFRNKKMILAVIFLALIVISLLFYFTRIQGKRSFDETKVKISVETLSNISSGEEIVFDIKYDNNTNVNLKNVKISLFIPMEFLFISSDGEVNKEETVFTWNFKNISASESGNIKLFGKVIGELNKEYHFNSKISYTPENFNYEFESDGKHGKAKVKITSVPFELLVQSPQSVISGDEIEYAINYKNISDYDFKFVSIEIEFPEGFACSSFNIEPDKKEGNFLAWNINNLSSGAEGKFIINGKVETDINIDKEMRVTMLASEDGDRIFKYASKNAVITVQEIPITIEQFINGSEEYFATKGEELEYAIKFKNISSQEIKGLVINSELAGEVDLDSLEIINGYYNAESNKIVWSALNVPELASLGIGEKYEVSFKIKVKDYIEIKKPEDKNFVIKNTATVNSFNFNSGSAEIKKTIASNRNIVKLKSFLFIKTKGYFNDDGRIKNIGVIPPETGKETSYLIHWNIGNLFNEINDVKIVSVLPEGVSWTGNYINSKGGVSLGNELNGTFSPQIVDPKKINNVNSHIGSEYGVSYNWYKTITYNDPSHYGLPENLKVEDMLKFTFSDGNINETDYCTIKSTNEEFYCNVLWKVYLEKYGEMDLYKIEKVISQYGNEKFFYNIKTREVIWEIPKLDANTGITSPVQEVVFQIRIKPIDFDIGKVLQIMGNVTAIGYDEFVRKEIEAFSSELTTNLPDDYSIGIKEGIVIEGLKDEEE